MDLLEKLLEQETDVKRQGSHEKHEAAVEFWTSLKVAKVMPTHGKKRKQSIKSQALAGSKLLQSRSGVKPVKLPVRTAKVKVVPSNLPGQASQQTQSKPPKYKKVPSTSPAPSRKIKLLSELKKKKIKIASEGIKKTTAIPMGKQASWLRPITALSRGGRALGQSLEGARAGAKLRSEAVKDAFTPAASRAEQLVGWGKEKVKKVIPQETAAAIGGKYHSARRGVGNFLDPKLARARATAHKKVTDYLAKAGPKPVAGPELVAWQKGYDDAVAARRQYLKTFRSAVRAGDVSGFGTTGSQVLSAIKGGDGKISPASIYTGLEGLGLTSPEGLGNMASSAYRTVSSAKKAREAAKFRNQAMMLGGGAAGLGTVALLKNRRQEQPSIPVHLNR